jgi:hypothetical protein
MVIPFPLLLGLLGRQPWKSKNEKMANRRPKCLNVLVIIQLLPPENKKGCEVQSHNLGQMSFSVMPTRLAVGLEAKKSSSEISDAPPFDQFETVVPPCCALNNFGN